MATKKIYPIGVSDDALLFYNAAPSDDPIRLLTRSDDGLIINSGSNELMPVSLLAILSRTNGFKPFDDSPLSQLVVNPKDSDRAEWGKLVYEKDKATIAKYTQQPPTAMKLPEDYPPESVAVLRSAGIAVEGARRVIKKPAPASPMELEKM